MSVTENKRRTYCLSNVVRGPVAAHALYLPARQGGRSRWWHRHHTCNLSCNSMEGIHRDAIAPCIPPDSFLLWMSTDRCRQAFAKSSTVKCSAREGHAESSHKRACGQPPQVVTPGDDLRIRQVRATYRVYLPLGMKSPKSMKNTWPMKTTFSQLPVTHPRPAPTYFCITSRLLTQARRN